MQIQTSPSASMQAKREKNPFQYRIPRAVGQLHPHPHPHTPASTKTDIQADADFKRIVMTLDQNRSRVTQSQVIQATVSLPHRGQRGLFLPYLLSFSLSLSLSLPLFLSLLLFVVLIEACHCCTWTWWTGECAFPDQRHTHIERAQKERERESERTRRLYKFEVGGHALCFS